MVKVVGVKGLAESKDRPSTTYALGKYIPHFRSVVGVGPSTKSLRARPEQADGPGRAKAVRNISYFEKVPERGRLLEGNSLVSNEVDFKMQARPDWELVSTRVD